MMIHFIIIEAIDDRVSALLVARSHFFLTFFLNSVIVCMEHMWRSESNLLCVCVCMEHVEVR